MPVGKVEQHDVASGALDQGADRGAVVGPTDQITLPVAWHRSVGGFSPGFRVPLLTWIGE